MPKNFNLKDSDLSIFSSNVLKRLPFSLFSLLENYFLQTTKGHDNLREGTGASFKAKVVLVFRQGELRVSYHYRQPTS